MSVDPPYGVILDSLLSGYVVPVLGAGASLIGRPPVEWNGMTPQISLRPAGNYPDSWRQVVRILRPNDANWKNSPRSPRITRTSVAAVFCVSACAKYSFENISRIACTSCC